MILTGPEIAREVALGKITIDPFHERHLNPNSYNFALGKTIHVYQDNIPDCAQDNLTEEITLTEDGLVLFLDRLYLGHIEERIGSDRYVPIMRGRSSIGRLGLFINITADLIGQGAFGQWTLQLHAVQPLRIYPGVRIGQITFWKPQGRADLYRGKYQNAVGPVASKSWMDFQR